MTAGVLTLCPENIPEALGRCPQWVTWRREERDGKHTKVPCNAKTGMYAKVDDPTTWTTFEDCLAVASGFDGLGFVLTKDDPFFGVDLDKCIDPTTGRITAEALGLMEGLRSYTERSPSGLGIRIFCRGTLPGGLAGKRKGPVEFYASGRYLTVTGHHLDGFPHTIEERTVALDKLWLNVFPEPSPIVNGHGSPATPRAAVDDGALLQMMLRATNGHRVDALWRGNTETYPSPSEADAAFCAHLAFWTSRNPVQMDRLFRQSALMRPKWDEPRGERTYGERTIAQAVAHCRESYTPSAAIPPEPTTPIHASVEPLPRAESEEIEAPPSSEPFAIGLGEFLAQTYPPAEAYVENILSSDGGGWIGGEEKLGKTFYALEEALCLATAQRVCGRFAVLTRRRVLFIEEEDGPRRTHARISALLRGHGMEPDEESLREELNAWFRLVVWSGFTFDDESLTTRLETEIRDFSPAVIYVDVLRKVTARDLNKAPEASALLALLDRLRRQYGVLFRVLHHYRKSQGFRSGRGSQEIGGSYVLGAWAENSLFFEPIGRKQGAVRVEAQGKDGPPTLPFQMKIESEGPMYAPTLIRLHAEEISAEAAGEKIKEAVFEAIATLPKQESVEGDPGVSLKAIREVVKKSDRPVRTAIDSLMDDERIMISGKATKQKKLYAVRESKIQHLDLVAR